MRLVNNADPSVVYTETLPNQPLRFWNDGGSLAVRNDSNNQIVFFSADTVVLTWGRQTMSYQASTGTPMWHSHDGADCHDAGFAGGAQLVEVYKCGGGTQQRQGSTQARPRC